MNKQMQGARRYRATWLLGGLILTAGAFAQIRTDGSLGGGVSVLSGPNFVIPQSIGRLAGGNLFHSFSVFNINTGESARFTTASPGINNVISRVTGGSPSQIYGPLSLVAASGAPNFYFINPAGVTFGAGSSIDVPGAFHVSTANYLKFPDGNFYADPVRTSTFSSIDPVAFGFLGSTRGTLAITGTILSNSRGAISLSGSDIIVDRSAVATTTGDINLIAVGGTTAEVMPGSIMTATGNFDVLNGSVIGTEATASRKGGDITIAAGASRVMKGSYIATTTGTAQVAGAIQAGFSSLTIDGRGAPGLTGFSSLASMGDIGAGGSLAISVTGGTTIYGGGMIISDAYGLGRAGNLLLDTGWLALDGSGHSRGARITNRSYDGGAGTLDIRTGGSISLTNNSQISSDSFGSGQAGGIRLNAGGDVNVLAGSNVASNAYASGNAGSIGIVAENLRVDSTGSAPDLLTQISSQALYGSQGNAGSINISARNSVILSNGGKILTSTNDVGQAGDIQVRAGRLIVDGADYSGSTGIFSTSDFLGTGDAGTLTIDVAGDAQLLRSGEVSTSTWGQGNGGRIVFKANNLTIDGRGDLAGAGISSESTFSSSGRGGAVDVEVSGSLRIADIGSISSSTSSSGNAGSVSVRAGSLAIDGGALGLAGIESSSLLGGSGNAGNVSVAVSGDAHLTTYGYVRSDTWRSGSGGEIGVSVGGNLRLDRGGVISSTAGGSGDAGSIGIQVGGELIVGGGGRIRTDTKGSGNAGNIAIGADRVTLDRGNLRSLALILSDSEGAGSAGSIQINARSRINLADGGFISSDAYGSGNAGTVSLAAPNVRIGSVAAQVGAAVSSDTYGSGNAGRVAVTADDIWLTGGDTVYPSGILSASYWNESGVSGSGGTIDVRANQSLLVADLATISSSAYSTGHAGTVRVTVGGDLSVRNTATIASATFAEGNAGAVVVDAGSLTVDGRGNRSFYTGITSQAVIGSMGNAGDVTVNTAGRLSVLNGGAIDTNTWGGGNAGHVRIAAGSVLVDRGTPDIYTGITSSAGAGSSGDAGHVEVRADGDIALLRGGNISSLTMSSGNAGSVRVSANNLTIDRDTSTHVTGISSSAAAGSSGHAGNVEVVVNDQLLLARGGMIDSLTMESGNAGSVRVEAGAITLDRQGSDAITAITSLAAPGSTGNAGSVEVIAHGSLDLINGGRIDSATYGAGAAGAVRVAAGDIAVDGRASYDGVASTINAFAAQGSSGQTGQVAISATRGITVANGGELSLRNDATVADPAQLVPTMLTVSAPAIRLDGGEITAAATGNVAASGIRIDFGDRLSLDRGSITTSANAGNGGPIDIQDGRLLDLTNSQITTSVLGLRGNGGDIRIGAEALAMNTGFIQANTAAANASGGNVRIDVATLLPSGSTLFVGGQVPYRFAPGVYGFNVIQAAAPTGVSGTIEVSAPVLDVSGSLIGLSGKVLDSGGLGRNPCRTPGGNSFTLSGRGYYPVQAGGVLDGALLAPVVGSRRLGDRLGSFVGADRECGRV